MFATLSVENRLRDRMALLNISGAMLAALAGVQPAKISRAFRGLEPLKHDDAQKLLQIAGELMELVEAVKPLALPLDNAIQTGHVLNFLRKNGITPEQLRSKISELFADI